MTARLAVIVSHPIQYHAPLFRRLAQDMDLHVLFAHKASAAEQARAGFGTAFEWDVDLTSGYEHTFMRNVAKEPGTEHFRGCDTPDVGRHLDEGRFAAVLVMGWHLKAYVQGIVQAKRLGLPVMVRGDSHLDTPRSHLKRAAKGAAYPVLLRVFDAALYVGQRSRAYYEHYRFPGSRLYFSPHCVDTEWFAARSTSSARASLRARYGIATETRVALFAGKLVGRKRPRDLIGAAAISRSRGKAWEVMIAGDGELRHELEDAAKQAAVPLHVLGFCNQTEMPAAYAAADCLVLPSDGRETWGLVANEALASGRPVVLSDACGATPDLAGDGIAGRAFPLGDVAALADTIDAVLETPPPAEALLGLSSRYSLDAACSGIRAAHDDLQRARKRGK